jgi:hypothetical protein
MQCGKLGRSLSLWMRFPDPAIARAQNDIVTAFVHHKAAPN